MTIVTQDRQTPPADWWQTPLGKLCATTFRSNQKPVTHTEAATMLGVTKGTVSQLVARNNLTGTSEGIEYQSILTRINQLQKGEIDNALQARTEALRTVKGLG